MHPKSVLRRRKASVLVALSMTFAVCAASTPARAAEPAAAQALFDSAKRLMNEGRVAEACPKLEESERLDPGIGTLFQLGVCYERVGRTASAWATFLEVAGRAKAAGQRSREVAARDRAAVLERSLPRLAIGLLQRGSEPIAGLEITRDGEVVGNGQWGAALPVDPGEHTIVARAPRRKTWTTVITVRGDGKIVNVVVPPLEEEAAPPAPPPVVTQPIAPASNPSLAVAAPENETSTGSGQRAAGVVFISLGLASLATGGAFILGSRGAKDASDPHCNGNVCDAYGVQRRDDARMYGDVATITLGAGAAVFIGGLITYLTSPSANANETRTTSKRAEISPMVGPGLSGIRFGGTF